MREDAPQRCVLLKLGGSADLDVRRAGRERERAVDELSRTDLFRRRLRRVNEADPGPVGSRLAARRVVDLQLDDATRFQAEGGSRWSALRPGPGRIRGKKALRGEPLTT